MKKYALLIGILWSFVSCSPDELDNTAQNTDIQSSLKETDDFKDKDWDKTRYNDDNPPSNEGGN